MTEKSDIFANESVQLMVWEKWEDEARNYFVGCMRDSKVTYGELSRRLEKLGIFESPDTLNRKVNRKRFSVAFMFACMEVMPEAGQALTEVD